ncbi:metal-sensing transcriptional repressor [Acidisoma silvae]|uniref:Metal-sensing transcriptional repressor n=1 Tax=Acidisoma silvae TaxID=2802396 RepID=A0A963YWT0_9PROT|nr:metal-sensing transcriptional repressor [Acidisoma silvae]MCB8878426.1 metal-sensing transcriptional repressor [Acidisoma silvae]
MTRSAEEKAPLAKRLNRIEGQVRGLRQMAEEDRYFLDGVQQASAITAAMRELTLLIISQHLTAGVDFAIRDGDSNAAIKDMMSVLRAAYAEARVSGRLDPVLTCKCTLKIAWLGITP